MTPKVNSLFKAGSNPSLNLDFETKEIKATQPQAKRTISQLIAMAEYSVTVLLIAALAFAVFANKPETKANISERIIVVLVMRMMLLFLVLRSDRSEKAFIQMYASEKARPARIMANVEINRMMDITSPVKNSQ